jgi:membrane protein DedA with SNARE-associated domain
MTDFTQFLLEHGTPVLFGVVLVEQAGLPLPAIPWLLAAGALAAVGKLSPVAAISVTVLACLISDSAWFYIGRRNGKRVLSLLGRMSLEPNRCAHRSERFLAHHAARGLLGAKFLGLPGMAIPPLAGTTGMSYRRFLFFDGVGSLLYSSCGIVLGFIFSEQLQQGVMWLRRFGVGASALVLTVIAGYIAFKLIKRKLGRLKRLAKRNAFGESAACSFPRGEALVPESAAIPCGAQLHRAMQLETENE